MRQQLYMCTKEVQRDPTRWGLAIVSATGDIYPVLQLKAPATSIGSADADVSPCVARCCRQIFTLRERTLNLYARQRSTATRCVEVGYLSVVFVRHTSTRSAGGKSCFRVL